jgi:hypothetical protein
MLDWLYLFFIAIYTRLLVVMMVLLVVVVLTWCINPLVTTSR